MVVRGPLTGKRYTFRGAGSLVAIDRRDVAAMTATKLFDPA